MELREAIERRQSIKQCDETVRISDEELTALFALTVRSPSSFNLQHWRFIVVRDPEHRARLSDLAWGQRQVAQASAVIIVLGNLKAHRDAGEIYAGAPEAIRAQMVPLISGFYQGKPQLQRDEAIRSGSLAAMTLMLVATDMGFDTCPMIGFEPEAVSDYLGIDEMHIPVMMICLGKRAGNPPFRSNRLPPEAVVMLERFGGDPLRAKPAPPARG